MCEGKKINQNKRKHQKNILLKQCDVCQLYQTAIVSCHFSPQNFTEINMLFEDILIF